MQASVVSVMVFLAYARAGPGRNTAMDPEASGQVTPPPSAMMVELSVAERVTSPPGSDRGDPDTAAAVVIDAVTLSVIVLLEPAPENGNAVASIVGRRRRRRRQR